jgi:hypothetical protein
MEYALSGACSSTFAGASGPLPTVRLFSVSYVAGDKVGYFSSIVFVMEEPEVVRFGQLEVRVEHDLICMRMRDHGRLTADLAKNLLEFTDTVTKQHGRHFILVDLRESGGVAPDARRLILDTVRVRPPSAVAFHGGNLVQKAMNMLLVNAVKLLGGPCQNIAQFRTDEEARAWLRQQR